MTIPVSSVPAARRYLLAAIQTQLAMTPTQTTRNATVVIAGDPTSPDLPDDVICIGEVARIVEPGAFVGGGGTNWLEEHYDITILCSSWRGGTTEEFVTARAWTLVAFVETAVRLTPGLGGLVQIAYPSRTASLGPVFTSGPGGRGPQVTAEVTVHCERLA